MKYYVSFDYSITSPSMCVFDGNKYLLYALTSTKKHIKILTKNNFTFIVEKYPDYDSPQDRYHKLANHFLTILESLGSDNLEFAIEDYAFAAKGKVFHIAENTQCLKGIIYNRYQKEMLMVSPNSLKKLFSDHGNANKDRMAEEFKNRNSFLISEELDAPSSSHPADMVDSYAVCDILYKIDTGKLKPDSIKKK